MKTITLGTSNLQTSSIALGCMRMNRLEIEEASQVIKTALDVGINFFDHADIYGGGESEAIFAKAIEMTPSVREKIYLQSKCSIVPGIMHDTSKEHIISSVEGSLKRLRTEYLDTLLIHRPDLLMEPEEIAETFETLYESGKVKQFGVSNHTPMQIELLNKYLTHKVIINQLQFGIMHTGMLDAGLYMNMTNDTSINRDGEVLDYCRLNDITIQAWSPFQYGFFEGVFLDNEKFPVLNQKLEEIAMTHQVSKTAIATAWILRHPANIQTIVGSMNASRLREIATACEVTLTREEWYGIYIAAGHKLP